MLIEFKEIKYPIQTVNRAWAGIAYLQIDNEDYGDGLIADQFVVSQFPHKHRLCPICTFDLHNRTKSLPFLLNFRDI
jgi:hypothetical protein